MLGLLLGDLPAPSPHSFRGPAAGWVALLSRWAPRGRSRSELSGELGQPTLEGSLHRSPLARRLLLPVAERSVVPSADIPSSGFGGVGDGDGQHPAGALEGAHAAAEPGVLFWDTAKSYTPSDIYADEGFGSVSTNPCGEIILSPHDSCRLMLLNLRSFVHNAWTKGASFDFKKFANYAEYFFL